MTNNEKLNNILNKTEDTIDTVMVLISPVIFLAIPFATYELVQLFK